MVASRRARLVGIAAGVLPLALYVRTAAPTVYGVDSAELATGSYILGITHPPGAPAYLLLAHAFTWLPIGDVGYRVNLFSAVAGALAMYVLYHVLMRLGGDVLLALTTVWVIAFGYYVWTAAVAAELYAPQACVVAALIALALRWRASESIPVFWALCLLAGIGLGVHLSLVLMLPGLAVLTLMPLRGVRRSARVLLGGSVCGVLGAAIYAYVPIRALAELPLNPARDYWHVDLATWSGFWWMISGAAFRQEFFAVRTPGLPAEIGVFAYRLWSNFLGVPVLFGIIGAAAGLRRQPWVHLGLLLMLLGHLGFFLCYGARDKETMFVPAYLIWGIWIGLGMRAAARTAAPLLVGRRDAPALAPAALLCIAALLVLINFPLADVSQDRSARDHAEALVDVLAPNAVFVGSWSDVRLLEYAQRVDGRRPDIALVDTFFAPPAERADAIAAALHAGHPVYVSTCRDLPEPSIHCEYVPACECHRLRDGGTG
jgi:hypothetical protein